MQNYDKIHEIPHRLMPCLVLSISRLRSNRRVNNGAYKSQVNDRGTLMQRGIETSVLFRRGTRARVTSMPDDRNKSRRRRQSAATCVRGKPTTWMNLPFMRASNPFLQPPSHRLWDLVGYQRHDYATHTHNTHTTNVETQRWKERKRERKSAHAHKTKRCDTRDRHCWSQGRTGSANQPRYSWLFCQNQDTDSILVLPSF